MQLKYSFPFAGAEELILCTDVSIIILVRCADNKQKNLTEKKDPMHVLQLSAMMSF